MIFDIGIKSFRWELHFFVTDFSTFDFIIFICLFFLMRKYCVEGDQFGRSKQHARNNEITN